MERHATFVISDLCFLRSIELEAFTLVALAELGDIIKTENHVLRRHGDRCAVCRVKNVVCAEHQHLCLKDSLVAKRKVNGHLVTVEVGVECRTCERMQLDCLTLDHLGLEGLDTETVKCRGSVEQHGMTFHHVFKDIPYNGFLAVNDLLGRLDSLHDTALDELTDNERLVKLGGHIFGDTAFVHLQLRTYDNNRTC